MREYNGKPFTYTQNGVERKDWRLYVVHYVAKAVGILIHFRGFPYGSSRNVGSEK